ncbi:unnamed protein product [Closterium sp. NIES-53]
MAAQELRWLTYLLTDLGEQPCSPPVLYVDNKAMLALCREHRLEHRTKHIALRYFLARELQQRGQLRLAYVASEANTTDIFTKALAPACFALVDWSCDLLFSPTLPMGDVLGDKEILHHILLPYAHLQQGVVERTNRTLMTKVCTLLKQSRLPAKYWPYAMHHAVRLLSLLSTTANTRNLSPHMKWTLKKGVTAAPEAPLAVGAALPSTAAAGAPPRAAAAAAAVVGRGQHAERGGLGLWDESDITVKGLAAVRRCQHVFLETYTSMLLVDRSKLVCTAGAAGIVIVCIMYCTDSKVMRVRLSQHSCFPSRPHPLRPHGRAGGGVREGGAGGGQGDGGEPHSPPAAAGRQGGRRLPRCRRPLRVPWGDVCDGMAGAMECTHRTLLNFTSFTPSTPLPSFSPPGALPVYRLPQCHVTHGSDDEGEAEGCGGSGGAQRLCAQCHRRHRRAALQVCAPRLCATVDTEALAHGKSELQKRHTCTDVGGLTSYLGLRITRDRAQRTITLTRSHMVQQVLQRFGFTYSSPQSTPLPTGHSLSAPPSDESVEPSGPYPELVGCLMYLMTCTRPDLAYPLSILARYVAPGRHRKEHMDAAKRVLRYLCSTPGMGLALGGRARVVLTGHADASWVDDLTTQRSSQGYTFSLGSGSVSWRSTRSSSVLSSSCEAKIYAGAMAAQLLRWLTYLLTDLGEVPRSPPVLYVDNKAMIALCQEHRLEHRTKHIALRYFLARELQQRGQLRLAYVATQANTADIFTKALQPCDHQRFLLC